MSAPPPDVESLRFYLTLPMYHEFKNITNSTILQVPYAEALLYLNNMELLTTGKYTYNNLHIINSILLICLEFFSMKFRLLF